MDIQFKVNKMTSQLLKLRNKINSKRPKFLRHETWKKKTFQNNPTWRKPKGKDNKMRMKRSGKAPLVSIGYRGPKEVRDYHPSGFKEVFVSSLGQLEGLDNVIIRINSSVGNRKKIQIVKKAAASNIKIANPAIDFIKINSVEDFDEIDHIKNHIKRMIVPLSLESDVRSEIIKRAEDAGIEVEE